MFNWFKRKNDRLIPQDISLGLMSSFFASIKLGEKIDIPEDVTCFVCYNDKTYASITSGTHSLTRELLLSLCERQSVFKHKTEKLNVDLFFVNCKVFDFEFSYVDKVPVNGKLTKLIFDVALKVKVEDAKKFFGFVSSEFAEIRATSTNKLLLNTVEDFLRKCFLHKKLTNLAKYAPEIADLNEKTTTFLKKIGIETQNFELNIASKNQAAEQIETPKSTFSFFESAQSKIETETKLTDLTQNTIQLSEPPTQQQNTQERTEIQAMQNENFCPVCKTKLIENSVFCHRCGYKRN